MQAREWVNQEATVGKNQEKYTCSKRISGFAFPF